MKNFFIVACLVLAGCTSLPPAIKDPPAVDIGYPQVLANPNNYKNAPVRWGGTIVEVENEPTFSAIQVLSYPLGSYGHPDTSTTAQGRFVIKSATFLDPAIYAKNTLITVAGIIEGETERTVDKKTLKLPSVTASQLHLWQADDYSNYRGFSYGSGFGYGGGYPYGYGGFYGYGPYYPGALYGYSPYYRSGGYWGGGNYGPGYRR